MKSRVVCEEQLLMRMLQEVFLDFTAPSRGRIRSLPPPQSAKFNLSPPQSGRKKAAADERERGLTDAK